VVIWNRCEAVAARKPLMKMSVVALSRLPVFFLLGNETPDLIRLNVAARNIDDHPPE
jgi:hypothetical protein